MEIVNLKSGKVLSLGLAPFSAGNKLRKVIFAELRGVQIDADRLDMDLDLGGLGRKGGLAKMDPKMLNTLKNVVCQLMSSDAVEACFFECAARCLLGQAEGVGEKITRQTFDSPAAVGDFLPAAWEVIKFNLAPFFEHLDLSSLTSEEEKKDAPA